MAIATLSRAGTVAMRPSARLQQQRRGAAAGTAPTRASRAVVAPRAWARSSCSSWSSADAERFMRDAMNEMRDTGAFSVYWTPNGVTFGSQPQQQQCRPNNNPAGGAGAAPSSSAYQQQQPQQRLALDVVERADAYVLYADVPGLSKRDLSIRLGAPDSAEGGRRALKIEGARAAPWAAAASAADDDADAADDTKVAAAAAAAADEQQQVKEEGAAAGGARVRRQERRIGAFARKWWLPDDAAPDGIRAKVDAGVLTVTVAKRPPPPEQEEQSISIG